MEISIRKACSGDLSHIVALMREFAEYENLGDYCDVSVEKLMKAMFAAGSFVKGLIAFDDQTAVGYALYYPSFSSFRGQRGLYLEDIFVKSDHQGRGLGLAMIRQIAHEAASSGYERIDFQVLDWNTPAINFYKKHGAVCNSEETHFKFSDDAFLTLADAR